MTFMGLLATLVVAQAIPGINAAPAEISLLSVDDVERAGRVLSFIGGHAKLMGNENPSTLRAKESYFVRFAQTHMPHTAKMAQQLKFKTVSYPGRYNTTHGRMDTGAGCFQCTSGCSSSECKACHALTYAADDDMPQYCSNQTRSYGFKTTTAESCGKCKCCSLLPQASCEAGSGLCSSGVEVDLCLDKMSSSPLYGSDEKCQALGKYLQASDFTQACASECFPTFMGFYTEMYNMKCAEDIAPQAFADVICGKVCTPSAECMEMSDELLDDLKSDEGCASTVEAINTMYTQGKQLSRGQCGGRCWSKVLATYGEMYSKDCFTCESSLNVPSPALLEMSACAPTPTPVPMPEGDKFEACTAMVTEKVVPLRGNQECSWMFRTLVSGKNLTTVCESNCFAQYKGVYEELVAADCVPGEVVLPDDFDATICSLGVMQTQGNMHEDVVAKASRVEAVLILKLSAVSPTQFTLKYWDQFSSVISVALNISSAAITLVDVQKVADDMDVSVSIKTPAALSAGVRMGFKNLVESGDLATQFNTALFAANAPIYVPSIALGSTVEVLVKSFCDPAQNEVSNLCIDITGCPTANPTVECCTTLMQAIGQGCDVNMEVCGTTMTAYVYDKCPMMSDELSVVEEWYSNHQSKSISASASDTFSQTASPSTSFSSSASPTLSASTTASAFPTTSPVDVFDLEPPVEMVEVSYQPPSTPYIYWGKRQTCDTNDDGTLNVDTCRCNKGYTGTFCEIGIFHNCPRQCSDNGVSCSASGNCTCTEGFGGIDCSRVIGCRDSNFCSGKGLCQCSETGCKCICSAGFKGESCNLNTFKCPYNCRNRGTCSLDGKCICQDGYAGADCGQVTARCPLNCTGKGECEHSSLQCQCTPGFMGKACEFVDVQLLMDPAGCAGCSGGGYCDAASQTCKCAEGKFEGRLCETRIHPFNCSDKDFCGGRGYCNTSSGNCICEVGYEGASCERVTGCPNDCSGHGSCVGDPRNATCRCRMAWSGDDCSRSRCAMNARGEQCSFRGICEKKNGTYSCLCAEGTRGRSCNITIPSQSPSPSPSMAEGSLPSDSMTPTISPSPRPRDAKCENNNHCSDNGICDKYGVCDCFDGWSGRDCGTPTADNGDTFDANEFSL